MRGVINPEPVHPASNGAAARSFTCQIIQDDERLMNTRSAPFFRFVRRVLHRMMTWRLHVLQGEDNQTPALGEVVETLHWNQFVGQVEIYVNRLLLRGLHSPPAPTSPPVNIERNVRQRASADHVVLRCVDERGALARQLNVRNKK